MLRKLLRNTVALILISISAAIAQDKQPDTIYVARSGQDGIFVEQFGQIITIDSERLLIKSNDSRTIYERAVVDNVVMAESQSQEFKDIAEQHWNQGSRTLAESLITSLRDLPVIGNVLAAILALLSGPIQLLIFIISLIGLTVYATYQAYISISQRQLNFSKLNMEVVKLRNELESIGLIAVSEEEPKRTLGGVTSPILKRTAEPNEGRVSAEFGLPELDIRDFIMHRVLGLYTAEKKQAAMQEWIEIWQRRGKNLIFLRTIYYYYRVLLNWNATFFTVIISLTGITGPVLVFTDDVGLFEGEELLYSLSYLAYALVGIVIWPRLRQKYKVMSETYRQVIKMEREAAPG